MPPAPKFNFWIFAAVGTLASYMKASVQTLTCAAVMAPDALY